MKNRFNVPLVRLFGIIALAVIGFSFAACGGDDNGGSNPFIGTWECTNYYSGDSLTVTFNDNGIVTFTTKSSGAISGTYTWSGNTAQLTSGANYTFTVSGNTMTMTGGFNFVKK